MVQLDKMVDAEEGTLCAKMLITSSRFTSRDGVDNLEDPVSSLKPDQMSLTLFDQNIIIVIIILLLKQPIPNS